MLRLSPLLHAQMVGPLPRRLPARGVRAAGRGLAGGPMPTVLLPDRQRGRSARVYTVDPDGLLRADRDAEARGLERASACSTPTPTRRPTRRRPTSPRPRTRPGTTSSSPGRGRAGRAQLPDRGREDHRGARGSRRPVESLPVRSPISERGGLRVRRSPHSHHAAVRRRGPSTVTAEGRRRRGPRRPGGAATRSSAGQIVTERRQPSTSSSTSTSTTTTSAIWASSTPRWATGTPSRSCPRWPAGDT